MTRERSLGRDAVAGVVMGVQGVPDGLATGLLAGVNPLAGLYAYVVGTATGGALTSSSFMAVQGTGALAMVVADVSAVHNEVDGARVLFTLTMLTGVVMVMAGIFRLGKVLRFVSNAVMVGFITAVGVNIVLGQFANLTGYAPSGASRVVRSVVTLLHPADLQWRAVTVGVTTIGLIVVLERTRVGALSLVVAVVATSAVVQMAGWTDVATLSGLGIDLGALPLPQAPLLREIPNLIVPALSLAFVALVQGAGVAASFPNEDGTAADSSRDFIGQGAANVAVGVLQGMPVGGSMSGTSLNKAAGSTSRYSLFIASAVMAVITIALGDLVGDVAMPALAGLLMVVGYRTVKPANVRSVWKAGPVQRVAMSVTFALTLVIPLQFAVLVGVGTSLLLHAVRQSNQINIRRWRLDDAGQLIETDPPPVLPGGDVVVLQPYGSLFFAAAPVFESALPVVTPLSSNSVVILRLRGRSDLGTTFMDVLRRYADSLDNVGSKLVIVSANERIQDQLRVAGVTDIIGVDNLYAGDERVGATLKQAHADAVAWVDAHR